MLVTGILPPVSLAQSVSKYSRISRVTPDDGLSQGSNYFRYEDSRGFMWITANDALNRWDGAYVKVYNLARYFKSCPPLQQGYGFAEDDSGNLYIGSVRGLYRYDRSRDRFTLHSVYPNSSEATAMPFAVKDGKVWCFNRKYELAVFDPLRNNGTPVAALPLAPLPSIHIYELEGNIFYNRWPFFDAAGNIWIVTQREILRYNPADKTASRQALPQSFGKDVLFNSCQYHAATRTLNIASSKGLLILDIESNSWKRITRFGTTEMQSLDLASRSDAVFALRDQFHALCTDTAFSTTTPILVRGSTNYRLRAFGWDKANRLWLCDDGTGEVIFDFRRPFMPVMPDAAGNLAILKEQGVGRFAEMPSGTIKVGGIWAFNPSTGAQVPNYDSISQFYLTTIPDRKRKGIWSWKYAAPSSGLKFFFQDSNGRVQQIPLTAEDEALRYFQSALILDDGRLLCSFGSGLYWYDELKHRFLPLPDQPQDNAFYLNALSGHRIAISYVNKDMWLAEYEPGRALKFVRKILPGIQAFYVAEDRSRNQYWVGTNQGVYLLNADFKIIRIWDANSGLAGTNIYGILVDDAGSVWASHQRGLSSINLSTHAVSNYTPEDGVQGWDFNNRAFLKASDGTLYFGGMNGFNYFKPPLKRPDSYKPQIYLDEILVNDLRFMSDTPADAIGAIELHSDENKVAFHVIVRDLDGAQGQQLAYRLNESGWTRVASSSVISFASLSPGDYKLDLAVYDKQTNTTTIQKTQRFKIATPLYRAPWFLILLGIVSTAGIFYQVARTKLAVQRRVYLQSMALAQERQRITADLHDDIGASLSSLQVNSAVARRLLEKDVPATRLVLEKMEEQSREIADKVGDIIWSMKPDQDEFMSMSARIRNFAQDILGATEIEYEVLSDKAVDAAASNILLRKNVVFIAKEAINNAVKYSQATKLCVRLEIRPGWLILTVTDNGIGMDLLANGSGNGLGNMRKRAEELNGVFIINSSAGKGTEVKAELPLIT